MIIQIIELIKKEKNIFRFIVFLYIVGIVCGTLFTNYINNHDKTLLMNQVTNYISGVKQLSKSTFGIKALFANLNNNFLQLLIIYVLGLSLIGIITVILIIYFKGFISGITLSSFILKYKIKGIIYTSIYTVFCIIPYFICYTFISFFAIYVSLKVIKAFLKKEKLNFKQFLGKYIISFLICILLVIISSIIDSYLLPVIIKIF